MLALKHLVASSVLAAVMPAIAAPIFLDFEDLPLEPALVGNSYERQFGVVFTDNAYSIRSSSSTPPPLTGGSFTRYGDSSKVALGLFSPIGAGSTGFYINLAAGFGETFKMLYTSTLQSGGISVEVFGGENGTGGLIGTASLIERQAPCRDPSGVVQQGLWCTWDEVALDFKGPAKSVHISGVTGKYFFDNMAFGPLATIPPGTDVPEPGGIALSLAALGALAWTRKRYQR